MYWLIEDLDQLTQFYCLPFLRQMYIFRYYVLDNNGEHENFKKIPSESSKTGQLFLMVLFQYLPWRVSK